MPSFAHLHVHSEYSLLDGAGRVGEIISACKLQDMDSIALTDHGTMYGVVELYKHAKNQSIKPILGCEVYVAPRGYRDKEVRTDREYAHLVLLARNQQGYKNLMKLVSIASVDGFYYKPRIDYDLLAQYSGGLIALSACLAGDIPRLLSQGREQEAYELAMRLSKTMGENNFFIELQDHGIDEQRRLNPLLIDLANKAGLGLVATNDVHYVKKDDAEAQDILMCIQTGKFVDDVDRMKFATDEFYLKSPDEMLELFSYQPESLSNTVDIANRCDVELDFSSMHMPGFSAPDNMGNEEFLRNLCNEGLKKKYSVVEDKHIERLNYELNMIIKMEFTDYFLIVWDFIKYAKDNDIMVGPGRGSAAGSIVAYALDITNVDPLKYDLLFERFLNPERISMPDIDIDFCYERRQEVIDYVVEKYGESHVAQIITFGTMAARAAIRDVGRAMHVPYGEVDAIAKMVPNELNISLERSLKISNQLQSAYQLNEGTKKLVDMARKLEGLPRHASTHAAGVVISKRELTEYVPIQKGDTGITTQFSMGTLEELGLLKMDFLGLRTLTVIRDTVSIIASNRGETIDIDTMEFDDPEVYQMLGHGDTDGVFQLESQGMRAFLRELKPESFEDIIAGISLYRPGPMDQIPQYVACKHDPTRIRFDHPTLERILGVTYGCIVYQEQVMQIVRDMGGYSLGRSDLVRRAMAKKKADVMEQERNIFVNGLVEDGKVVVAGALRNGVDSVTANNIFDQMIDFAQYAFNKSHAAAYGVLAYQTAWLKYYYPLEFMTALINSYMGTTSKVAAYVHSCNKNNIKVMPPDINKSMTRFSPEDDNIRFGLAAIRNVGFSAAKSIIRVRENVGKFATFTEFIEKLPDDAFNKRMIESLIKAGCFDSLGYKRVVLMSEYEKVMNAKSQDRKRNIEGQVSLFDVQGLPSDSMGRSMNKETFEDLQEFDQRILLAQEKDMTGMYLSGHPLSSYQELLSSFEYTSLDINEAGENAKDSKVADGDIVKLGGIITAIKRKTTKSNQTMAYVTIEDLFSNIELIVFPNVFNQYSYVVETDALVVIKGRVSVREDNDPQIVLESVESMDSYILKKNKRDILALSVNSEKNEELLHKIFEITNQHKGTTSLAIRFTEVGKTKRMPRSFSVNPSKELVGELENLLGQKNVKYF